MSKEVLLLLKDYLGSHGIRSEMAPDYSRPNWASACMGHYALIVRKERPDHDIVGRIITCGAREPGNLSVHVGAAAKGSDQPHPSSTSRFATNYYKPTSFQEVLGRLSLFGSKANV